MALEVRSLGGIFENPKISFKKEEISNYVYKMYDNNITLMFILNPFMF